MKKTALLSFVRPRRCAAGPNFERPSRRSRRNTRQPASDCIDPGQRRPSAIVLGGDVATDWMDLVWSDAERPFCARRARGSPTIVAARSTLAQARRNYVAAGAHAIRSRT